MASVYQPVPKIESAHRYEETPHDSLRLDSLDNTHTKKSGVTVQIQTPEVTRSKKGFVQRCRNLSVTMADSWLLEWLSLICSALLLIVLGVVFAIAD